MNKYISISISFVILFPLGFSAYADKEVTPSVSHEEITKQSIRDQVKVLRQERYAQMPYLDRGYIRSSITPPKVRDKIMFVTGAKKGLQEVINRAVAVHTSARAARERMSLARRRILVALRALFPEATYEVQHRDGVLSASPFNSRNYKFSFRQPVFRGGILWHTLLQENVGLQSAEKEYDKVISDIVSDASVAYFEYQRTLQVIKDQLDSLERMRHFLEISRKKFEEKIISEIEHLNVESLYSQIEYDYETSKQEMELAELDLQRFLDLAPEDSVDILEVYDIDDLVAKEKSIPGREVPGQIKHEERKPSELKEHIAVPNLNELVDLAYESRPELQIESAKLQSARLEERIRWGELIPHADAVLEFGRLGEAFNVDSLDPKLRKEFRFALEISWNAGGNRINYNFENNEQAPSVSQFQSAAGTQVTRNNVSIGLLDGLQALVEGKEAEVDKLDQIVELENAEKEVVQDVKQAFFDYQKSLIQVESTLKRVDYRERLARLAEHRLGKNEIQVSEYIQAEIDLLRERTELHRALKDYFSAKAKLNRAVGRREFLPIEEKYGE